MVSPIKLAAIVAFGVVTAAGAASAHDHDHDHDWDRGRHHRHHRSVFVDLGFRFPGHRHYWAPPAVVYAPRRPVYVVPPPVVVQSPPAASSSGYCREFQSQVRVGNSVREGYGTACLQPDGSWRVVP
jgi:hypothetical protein